MVCLSLSFARSDATSGHSRTDLYARYDNCRHNFPEGRNLSDAASAKTEAGFLALRFKFPENNRKNVYFSLANKGLFYTLTSEPSRLPRQKGYTCNQLRSVTSKQRSTA